MKFLFVRLLTLFSGCLFVGNVQAITPQSFFTTPGEGARSSLEWLKSLDLSQNFSFGLDARYQIGEEWGKRPVTNEDLQSDMFFKRMAFATARVRGGGTGFYLGEFNGRHIMATNHHVCPSAYDCAGREAVRFPLLDITTAVDEFYGSWPEVDLALFSVKIYSKEKAPQLQAAASPFAFDDHLHRGQRLLTIGFGVADNPLRQLVANRDSDCIVFSGDGEYRLMADPDDLNPGDYKAWSFANGCDVSHGDSGSAMMDRDSGRVVGIIWTGRIPKSEKVQSSAYLQQLLQNPTEDIWKELSYGVPAVQMKLYLQKQIQEGRIEPNHVETLQSLLESSMDIAAK